MAWKFYTVLDRLRHDGTKYSPGSSVALNDTDPNTTLLISQNVIDGTPTGDAPDPESNSDSDLHAFGEPISLFRMVYQQADDRVYLANNDQEEQCRTALGIAVANENGQVRIKYEGKIVNSNWTFNRGKPLFLHNSGQIKQTVPSSGHVLQIGEALGKTSINLEIKEVEIRT